jgi:cyclophilin family peptidyl-prolyl cis-trans isomerase
MQVNEFLEIASVIGRLEPKSGDTNAVNLFRQYEQLMGRVSPEVEIAFATVDPIGYLQGVVPPQDVKSSKVPDPLLFSDDWHVSSSIAQALATYAADVPIEMSRATVQYIAAQGLVVTAMCRRVPGCKSVPDLAYPDVLRAYAAFKPQTLTTDLITALTDPDVIVRATAAELIAELPPTDEIAVALTAALPRAMHDELNDAALAILDALGKQKPERANAGVKSALDSEDLIIRRRAVAILKVNKAGDFTSRIGTTKSRNTAGDYQRALSRIGRTITAIVRTSKGSFTIQLLPDEAPLNVDNFVQLAKRGYFNGIVFHRVVPNFVVQGGDPRGDGNGGPGYQIRCEINEETYDRGAVGMALSGKDTGGSQWFVTHSPQPHLDGGYTVFGKVTMGMDVVDRIVRGDTIFGVSVTEGAKRASKTRRAVS